MASDHPFSRPVAAAEVPTDGLHLHLVADAAERAALARFLDVPAVVRLEAVIDAVRGRDGLRVTGTLEAVVTQVCVVSLEPFDAEVRDEVEGHYGNRPPPAPEGAARGSHAVDLDAPEPLDGGRADLGVLVTEFLALGLDPHPRKPGVAFAPVGNDAVEPPPKPFAALAGLAARRGGTGS